MQRNERNHGSLHQTLSYNVRTHQNVNQSTTRGGIKTFLKSPRSKPARILILICDPQDIFTESHIFTQQVCIIRVISRIPGEKCWRIVLDNERMYPVSREGCQYVYWFPVSACLIKQTFQVQNLFINIVDYPSGICYCDQLRSLRQLR